ncbi:hypothetical protein BU23DRAFT_494783, partial [Bimuria novae-zelandiae CBS 107.79]
WFDKLQAYEQRLAISNINKYNIDKIGIRIGVAKDYYVYTRRGRQVLIPIATNRELISMAECYSVDGRVIAPMLIIKAKLILE